jgi:O-antigen ligase
VYQILPVPTLFFFFLNLGGQTIGPGLPGLLNDYLFHDENMVGASISLTVGAASILMLLIFAATMRPYRIHYQRMENATKHSV